GALVDPRGGAAIAGESWTRRNLAYRDAVRIDHARLVVVGGEHRTARGCIDLGRSVARRAIGHAHGSAVVRAGRPAIFNLETAEGAAGGRGVRVAVLSAG